jgi:hypothetical protein
MQSMETLRRIVRYFETALEMATIRALEQLQCGDIVLSTTSSYSSIQIHVNFQARLELMKSTSGSVNRVQKSSK